MTEIIARPKVQMSPRMAGCRANPAPPTMDGRTQREFKAVAAALDAAVATEEQHDWSGDSDRLLRLASAIAQREAGASGNQPRASFIAFDVAALIKAARLVPGDAESEERAAQIAAAERCLIALTGDPACLRTGAQRAPRPPTKEDIESAADQGADVEAHLHSARLIDDAINAYGHALVVLRRIGEGGETCVLTFAALSLMAHEEAAFEAAASGGDVRAMQAASAALDLSLEVIQAAACAPDASEHKMLWAAQALAEMSKNNLDLCITALEQA